MTPDQEAKEIVAVAVDAFCKTVGHKGTNASIEAAVNAAAPLIIERYFLAAHAGEDEIVEAMADAYFGYFFRGMVRRSYDAQEQKDRRDSREAMRAAYRAIPRTHSCTEEKTAENQHRWELCEICGPMVVCWKCGNNSCNGGYGTLADGSKCDACPSAYELQDYGITILINGAAPRATEKVKDN